VTNASAGDTINVEAGSDTWATPITVSKGLQIIGAGTTETIIARGGTSIFVISDPANTNLARISGFRFNVPTGGEGGGILLQCSDTSVKFNIRIDHNLFTTATGTCTAGHCHLKNEGCRGVVDNNEFRNAQYPLGGFLSGDFPGDTAWANQAEFTFGAENEAMVMEDNLITDIRTTVADCDEGGRYIYRYNRIIGTDMYPFLDSHGGKGGVYSCMGVEIYGNWFEGNGFIHANQYAARSTAHHNFATKSSSISISVGDGCPVLEAERMNNTAYFLNRHTNLSGGTLMALVEHASTSCGERIAADVTYWEDNAKCHAPNTCSNITTGIGSGTLGNRPTSCTTGTWYWASTQSSTDLTGMVGINPSTPISGTMYRCTSTNTWTEHHTPLTYPHPLRGEGSAGRSRSR
jgi:hypothetical protein